MQGSRNEWFCSLFFRNIDTKQDMRKIVFLWMLAAVTASSSAFAAQDKTDKAQKREAVKQHLKAHYKPYGFIRNYFTFDTRESVSGTGDLFYYLPKDNAWNQTVEGTSVSGVKREDLNARSSFRFLALTTRVGLDIKGYQVGRTLFEGKVEADFYAGLSGSTGVAQLRLRQAFMTLAWDSLPMAGGKQQARVSLLMGQAWHPMAADLCDALSLNAGAPFGPFSRTPQVKLDARLGNLFTLTGAAIWQMQYTSAGPDGPSANYIKYGCTPEAYIGLSFHHESGVLLRAGADVLSISPRRSGEPLDAEGNPILGTDEKPIKVNVNDRLTTVSPFLYLQYKHQGFSLKAKSVFAEAGEHMNLNGGYGVKAVNADGSWEYTPTRNSSSWISMVYGGEVKGIHKLQGILFGGYVYNFGTKEALCGENGKAKGYWFSKNSFTNIRQMWRLSPALLWSIGKFQLGLEYELTSVQYGDNQSISLKNGLAENDLHWVTNHRLQLMTKYNF